MKLLIILSTVLCALAGSRNQQIKSGWVRQNIRSNNQIDPSSSSSESSEQSANSIKTQIFNSNICILVPGPTSDEIEQFNQWAANHNKQYFSEREKECRMNNVIKKLRDIQAHNERFDQGRETFTRALNHMSDMTRKEMEKNILMKLPANWHLPTHYLQNIRELPVPRPAVDYRDENLVGPVGEQKSCGSCWTWSSAAVIEGQLRKCGISEESVSVQSMLNCVRRHSDGCRGGFPIDVFIYEKSGGILPASKYPYRETRNRCSFNRTDIMGYVNNAYEYFSLQIPEFELFMRKLVSSVGPITTVLYADDSFDGYASGVFTSSDCNRSRPNHAVTIVGYGTDPKFGDYWLLKNSWGTTWGDKGYGKIARGSNLCHFESRIAFAEVTDKDRNICGLV